MTRELMSQHSAAELREGLRGPQAAPRFCSAAALLRHLEALAPRVGVTKVIDRGGLLRRPFPAFQSVRPRVFFGAPGQRSGSHGKGQDRTIAKIACLMEHIETVSAEPAPAILLRGSYDHLREHHALLDPRQLFRVLNAPPPRAAEPLLWTPAYHWELDTEVLVPAELVYFPLACASYGTRAMFPMSSNGTAASGTYAEAALGALYECVERMYLGMLDVGRAKLEAIDERDLTPVELQRFAADKEGYELQLFAVTLPGGVNVPTVVALLVGDDDVFLGAACAADGQTASRKAAEEALLAFAYASRERDIADATTRAGGAATPEADAPQFGFDFERVRFPQFRTLSLAALARRHRAPADPRGQLSVLIRKIHRLGYPSVCFANLTRVGLEIPVVRAIVPGMSAEAATHRSTMGAVTLSRILASHFSITTPGKKTREARA